MGVERGGYNGPNGAEVSEEPQEYGHCVVRQRKSGCSERFKLVTQVKGPLCWEVH